MMDELDIRHRLAGLFHDIAIWRRSRAEDLDRDPRNSRVAGALDQLAAWVVTLPPDDERLMALDRLLGAGDTFEPGQTTLLEIGRFRFYYPETSFDGFLSHLVETATFDRDEQGRFGGPTVPGDDPWVPRRA